VMGDAAVAATMRSEEAGGGRNEEAGRNEVPWELKGIITMACGRAMRWTGRNGNGSSDERCMAQETGER
jgi:hypothetical protein